MEQDEDSEVPVAVGEVGLWVHRLSDFKVAGHYLWEYVRVTVTGIKPGKRSTWLMVPDPDGIEHRVVAWHIYNERMARRWHPQEARKIWGKPKVGAQ